MSSKKTSKIPLGIGRGTAGQQPTNINVPSTSGAKKIPKPSMIPRIGTANIKPKIDTGLARRKTRQSPKYAR